MNNSDTQKKVVERTYQGADGFTPIANYLDSFGSMGRCLELALRPGLQHSAPETDLSLKRVLPMTTKLTPLLLSFRAEPGLRSAKIMRTVGSQAVALSRAIAFISKWNPHSRSVEAIAAEHVADTRTVWCHLRISKPMCLWTQTLPLKGVGTQATPVRRILRLFERTIVVLGICHNHGIPLLLPDYALAKVEIILLCLIGQTTFHVSDRPLRYNEKHESIETVKQQFIFKTISMIYQGRHWVLGLFVSDTAFAVHERHC